MVIMSAQFDQPLRGAAPTRNQVRSVALQVDEIAPGKLRLSSPYVRGWSAVVSTRDELVRAVAAAFTEVQIASYARWRGQGYDRDVETPAWRDDGDPMVATTPRVDRSDRDGRNDVHDPRDWVPLEDGRMRAPSGKVFGANTDAVRRVRIKRQRLGLDC
jgi:hypothetical protein